MKKSYGKWAEREAGSQLRLVALKEVVRQELREFVVSAGMVALAELLEEERTDLRTAISHQADRAAGRAGHAAGELVMGGRRIKVRRPRARSVDGREVELPSWKHFSVDDPLHERALTQMLVGVSTRKYERSLEPVAEPVVARGISAFARARPKTRRHAESCSSTSASAACRRRRRRCSCSTAPSRCARRSSTCGASAPRSSAAKSVGQEVQR